MRIDLELPAEVEAILRRRATAAGIDLETFVRQVVIDSLVKDSSRPAAQASAAKFERRLEAWTALHPVLDHAIDDSRESIYEGRGE